MITSLAKYINSKAAPLASKMQSGQHFLGYNMAGNYRDRNNGPVGPPRPSPNGQNICDVMVIDNKAYRIHKIIVHQFKLSDVDDPDLYAAQPMYEWRESEMGKWVMSRAVDTPEWHRHLDPMTYGYRYAIVAKLKDVDYTFWQLKWGSSIDSNN